MVRYICIAKFKYLGGFNVNWTEIDVWLPIQNKRKRKRNRVNDADNK